MRAWYAWVAAAMVVTAAAGCRTEAKPNDMFPLGGSWFALRHSGLPEAGARPTDLYREVNGARVLVQRNFGLYRYYPLQDCLVFEKPREDSYQTLGAVCGDRPAIAIEGDRPYRWRLDPDGLRATTGPVVTDGNVLAPTIPIEDIKDAADRGETVAPRGADRPIDVNFADPGRSHKTLLHDAVNPYSPTAGTVEQRLALMTSLLARGADVNARDDGGATALMFAAGRDEPSFIKPLLDAGANVNTQDTQGRSALMVAAESNRSQIEKVRMLLDAHADITLRDLDGHTAAERLGPGANPELLTLLRGR